MGPPVTPDGDDFKELVASNIRKLRQTIGLSQDDAAKLAEWSRSTWRGYEEGRSTPSLRAAVIIAKVLQCRVGDLASAEFTVPGDAQTAQAFHRFASRIVRMSYHYEQEGLLLAHMAFIAHTLAEYAKVSPKEPPDSLSRLVIREYLKPPK